MSAFHGLARVLSKRGICSRSEANEWIRAGRVRVRGKLITDPETRTRLDEPAISVDGNAVSARQECGVYIVLNKPRGLVTTTADELGRDTVFSCFEGAALPRLVPVGRLDKASEGMLLFTNDTLWADRITSPESHLAKTYHVQVKPPPSEHDLEAMKAGVETDPGEVMAVAGVQLLRCGGKTAWLEVVLEEGKNRQIRRIIESLGMEVLRLIRVAIGGVPLGDLAKGSWRHLSAQEVAQLASPVPMGPSQRVARRNAN
ncbi:MAG: pseudouridine synthase [Verrucomicrobiales bacterium]